MSVYRDAAERAEQPDVTTPSDHGDDVRVAPSTHACPRCDAQLTVGRRGKVEIFGCTDCGGAWLTLAQVENFAKKSYREVGLELAQGIGGNATKHPELERPVTCPFCERQAVRSRLGDGVRIDTCDDHGIWFDYGELASSKLLPDDFVTKRKPKTAGPTKSVTEMNAPSALPAVVESPPPVEPWRGPFYPFDDLIKLLDELLGTRR